MSDDAVLIVGAGIFGGAAYRLCKAQGMRVKVFDSGELQSGSGASGNLTKPEWAYTLNQKGKDGLAVLEEHFGLEKLDFRLPVGNVGLLYAPHTAFTVPEEDLIREQVLQVGDGFLDTDKYQGYEGKILVAAGVWSGKLVQMPAIQSLAGISFWYNRDVEARMSVWAPYKQAMSFSPVAGRTWFGDGTAVKLENLEQKHFDRMSVHAQQHGLPAKPDDYRVGQRPYVKGHKGYFERIYDRVWVSSGGAKMGVVLAAYQAKQFVEAIS